ncbi:MAG: OsmC family protein [Phycisphaerae bacterium]
METPVKTSNINGVNLDALGQTIEAIRQEPELGKHRFRVRNRWIGSTRNCSTADGYFGAGREQRHSRPFELHADEPAALGGADSAANPVEHLLHSLASCVTTSIVAHAAVRGIAIQEMESELEGDIDVRGFLGLAAGVPKGYTGIRVRILVKADGVDLGQLRRLAEFSPVYNTLRNCVPIDIVMERKT